MPTPPRRPQPPLARPPQRRRSTVIIEDKAPSVLWKILCFLLLVGLSGAWAFFHFNDAPTPPRNNIAVAPPSGTPELHIPDPTGKPPPDIIVAIEDDRPVTYNIPDHEHHHESGADEPPPPPPPKPRVVDAPRKLIQKTIKHEEFNPAKINNSQTLDTMIVYSTELLNDTFGGNHRAMLAHFDKIINFSNQDYKDHPCKVRLRLVGLVETEDVVPLEGDQCKNALGLLAGNKIKLKRNNVHKLRDQCGADTVTYIFRWNKGGGGGLASVGGPWAAINYPTGPIYHHELRHNGGWNHEDEDDWKMIERNAKTFSKWKSRRVTPDRLFLQYWGTGDEFDPPENENA